MTVTYPAKALELLQLRLLRRPVSESGRLRHGGGDPRGATAAEGG